MTKYCGVDFSQREVLLNGYGFMKLSIQSITKLQHLSFTKNDEVSTVIDPKNRHITAVMLSCFQLNLLFIILDRNIGIFLRRFTF